MTLVGVLGQVIRGAGNPRYNNIFLRKTSK